jgi:amino acid transporter
MSNPVKQEIAKEGILPFSLFFAKSYDLSFSRLRRIFSRSAKVTSQNEPTPVPALFLHLLFTTVLVVIPTLILRKNHPGQQSYIFIVTTYTIVLDVIFFVLIAIAMLYLRLAPGSRWRYKSRANHWLSIAASLVFFAATMFPLICLWIPDPEKQTLTDLTTIPWFAAQTLCAAVLGVSVLYWFGFRFIVPRIGKRRGMTFVIERNPRFHEEHKYPVQTFEEIAADWKLPNPSQPDETLIEMSRKFKQDVDD